MSYSNNINIVNDLKAALEELSKQTLPIRTRGILQNARTHLDQLNLPTSTENQDSRLAALYRVSHSLGFTLDLDEVLNQVMDAIIELTGAEQGFLTLIDPATGELCLRAARNIEKENLYSEDMKFSRTVIQTVIDSDKGVVTTDAQTDPRFAGHESVVHHSLRSILCAPLRSSGKILGVIYAENRAQSGIFSKEDLDLLNAFASQAAASIENARIYTNTDQALATRLGELETLSQIDRELNQELDLVRTLEITHRWATKGTGFEECWIGLSNEKSCQFKFCSGTSIGDPGIDVIDTISRKNVPQEISIDSKFYLSEPLIHGNELLGIIVVSSKSKFQYEEREYLTRLAGRASAAIANARLFQAVHRANESKSQFVSIVTHELRIPLTSIKGYTELIRQGIVGEINQQQLSFLDVINNNVQRMSRLISDLSDISRIERGKLHLESTTLHLNTYIDETISSLQIKVEEKNQSLTVEVPSNLPNVYADPSRLVQVLTNLISNAWKYTPEGGNISVYAFQMNSFVQVEIVDNGLGISNEDQDKLFTQFFRSEAQEIREQTGWGLGLNVTKKLVEIMGGKIGVKSILNEGSKFWFTLPIAGKKQSSTSNFSSQKMW